MIRSMERTLLIYFEESTEKLVLGLDVNFDSFNKRKKSPITPRILE